MSALPLSTETLSVAMQGIAVLGCMQAAAGAALVRRFRGDAGRTVPGPADSALPPVTVLKPLHGDEPLLEAALTGFLRQDYPSFQIVFGVQDPNDAAIAVFERLRRRFPAHDLRLVVDRTRHGTNRKVDNLINMLPHASHDLLVISDSDIHVAPDYLRKVAACLVADPAVGLVTTLYHGIPATPTLLRRLAASQVNHSFMPGVLLSRLLGRQDCLGSTMALSRQTLEAIGGLAMLSPHVADDSVLGKLVRGQGLDIALAPSLTATTIGEDSPSALFAHELRWGRTVRAVEPLGYALSAVQFPLFWAALAVAAAPGSWFAWLFFAAVWTLRGIAAALVEQVIRSTGQLPATIARGGAALPFLLLPLRDAVSALVMAASFSGSRVQWRGQMLHVAGWTQLRPAGARPIGPPPSVGRALAPALASRPLLAHAHDTLAQGD